MAIRVHHAEAAEDRLQANIEINRAVKATIEKCCALFATKMLHTLKSNFPDVLHNGNYAQTEHVKHCYSGWVKVIAPASLEKAASYLAETLGEFVLTLSEEIEECEES